MSATVRNKKKISTADLKDENLLPKLIEKLRDELNEKKYWKEHLASAFSNKKKMNRIHLGIFVEPFLGFIFDGKKTVESRFSVNKTAPYKKVQKGDVILLKQSGGPIVGVCVISEAWSYELDPQSWKVIKKDYAEAICALDPQFWTSREKANYATLMKINHVERINPFPFIKADRRGWIVIERKSELSLFK